MKRAGVSSNLSTRRTNFSKRLTNSAAPERSLRPGSELDLLFTDLLANGQAVGRAGGLVVFCFGPLPGERARIRITTLKRSYAVAEAVALEPTSPDRAQPFCPVFGVCGGCQMQHLAYPAQLGWKREALRNALQRIGGIDGAPVRDTIGMAEPRAYRNKMSLVVGSPTKGGDPKVGFYRMRSHDLVPIDGCPVVARKLDEYIASFAGAPQDTAARSILERARHIVARYARATGETVVALSTQRAMERGAELAAGLRAELSGVVGIVNTFEPRSANAVLGRRQRLLDGRPEIEERIAGIRYRVSTASFFQVNPEIVGLIFAAIERDLLPARAVVDLYCGMGTFSMLFGRHGAHVVGVEENAHAVAEANANAALNDLSARAEFHARRVEEFAVSKEGRVALSSADLVFLDPPRKGSDDVTLQSIAHAGAPRVAYLSCDPATLARDLRLLAANGYRLESVQPFDMFPQTGHVEALAFLMKSN
jgi:23S rRNA (uracil1939-C5)-methyltransferase